MSDQLCGGAGTPRPQRSRRPMNHDLELPPPFERSEQVETAISRLRYAIIAVLIAMIAGYAVLGVVVWQMIGRIDQLATKANGIDATLGTLGVKFDETSAKLATTNAKLDTISGRIAAEFKTMETQIKAMEAEMATQINAITKSIAATRSVAIPPPAPVQTKPAPVPKPAPPPPPRRRP